MKIRILAIDDSVSITNLIKSILKGEGIEVITANDGAEGVSLYSKYKPHLVTLDTTMPIMDGYETLGKILKLDKDAKVIMLTVSEHWPLIDRFFNRGAVGYLTKPFTYSELINMVKNPLNCDDRFIATFLSIALNRIQTSLQKILRTHLTIKLGNINHVSEDDSTNMIFDGKRIQYIHDTKPHPFTIEKPEGVNCFSIEFCCHQRGFMMVCIDEINLNALLSTATGYFVSKPNEDMALEIANTILGKFFSVILDMSNLILDKEPIKRVMPLKDYVLLPKKEILIASCVIKTQKFELPFEIELWTELKNLFARSR